MMPMKDKKAKIKKTTPDDYITLLCLKDTALYKHNRFYHAHKKNGAYNLSYQNKKTVIGTLTEKQISDYIKKCIFVICDDIGYSLLYDIIEMLDKHINEYIKGTTSTVEDNLAYKFAVGYIKQSFETLKLNIQSVLKDLTVSNQWVYIYTDKGKSIPKSLKDDIQKYKDKLTIYIESLMELSDFDNKFIKDNNLNV